MPAFTFNGFPVGSNVAVSASQNANSAAESVVAWGQTSHVGSLDILHIHSGELVAPAAVWFEAIDVAGFNVSAGAAPGEVYKPGFHEISYTWSFDDGGSFDPALNLPTGWNDRNVAYGPQVAHVFETPGTYTVQVTAREGTDSGVATVVITVQDPAVAYAGNRTILVDPAGIGDNAGYPGAQVFTSIPAAVSALEALGQTGRILLKRGEVYTNVKVNISTSMNNFRVGSWGSGAKPVLRPVPISDSSANSTNVIFRFLNASPVEDFCIYDLAMQGDWDAASESGDPRGEPLTWLTHTGAANPFYSVHGCDFSGFAKVKFGNISHTGPLTCVFNKVAVTNWQDYGLFGHGPNFGAGNKRFALVGSALRQSADALQGPEGGGGGKDGFTNDHGPFRTSQWDKVFMDACSFYSCNGWSGGPAGRTAAQACIRINTEGDLGAEWFVSRVACEGGWEIIDADAASSGRPDNPWNFVIDKALLVGTAQTTHQITLGSSGTTFRNIIGIMPDVAYEAGIGNFINYLTDNPQNNVHDEPVRLHSSTFVNLDSGDDMSLLSGFEIWNDYTEENVVFHAPHQPSPSTGHAPIDTTTPSGFVTVYPGKRVSTERIKFSLSGAVASGASVASVPYPSGTSQSDFMSSDSHAVLVGSDYYFADKGEISVSFGGSSITVTNSSGASWAAGTQITCNFKRQSFSTDTASASPSSVPLPRPQTGSPALTVSGGLVPHHDAFGVPHGTNPTQGALRQADT